MAKKPTEPKRAVITESPGSTMKEQGSTGLKGAYVGSGWLYEEFLVELRGANGVRMFRRMADNDPICSALLYSIEALIRGIEWRVEPAEDPNPPKPKPKIPPPMLMTPPPPGAAPLPVPPAGAAPAQKALSLVRDEEKVAPPDPVMVQPPPLPEEPEQTPFEKDAENAAKFLEGLFFEDMDVPFGDVINEALTMLPYGYSILEIVLKKRNGKKSDPVTSSKFDDGYVGIAKLAPRAQETIERFLFDDFGKVTGVRQYVPSGMNSGPVELPTSKILHFKTSSRLGNPEGRSLLRGAYVSWVRKNSIEDAEGRVAARSGGVVEMRVPGELLDVNAPPDIVNARNTYTAIADRMAQDRQGSVMLPSDTDENGNPLYEIKFAIPETRRQNDLDAMIQRYNRLMAMTVMADFLLLGHETVGSFALSDSKTTMFAKSCGAILDILAEQFNRVLIPKIWAWNGFDDELRPKLVHGDLETPDLAALGAYVTAMAGAGMPLFPDEQTENYLREAANLPAKSEESGGGAVAGLPGQPGQPGAPPGLPGAPPAAPGAPMGAEPKAKPPAKGEGYPLTPEEP